MAAAKAGELNEPAVLVKSARRADALRNHERLLTVARASIAERGGNIVLEDIARDAGLGVGTLYRHFPTRQSLLEAAFVDEAMELRARATELAHEPSAIGALVEWLRLQLDFGARGRSLGAAVMNAKHIDGSEIQIACRTMREAGTALLRRAQAAGEVRGSVEMSDILRLTHGMVLANEAAPDPDQMQRMFDLVVAGIRT